MSVRLDDSWRVAVHWAKITAAVAKSDLQNSQKFDSSCHVTKSVT